MNFSLPPVPQGAPLVAPPMQSGQPPETIPMHDAMAGQFAQPATQNWAQPWAQQPPPQTLAQAQQPPMPDYSGMQTTEQTFAAAAVNQAAQQVAYTSDMQQFAGQQPQAQPQAQPQLTFEQLCAHYVDVDAQLSAATAQYNSYEKSMKAIREKLEVAILSAIPPNVEAATLHGHVFKPVEKIRYQTAEGMADTFWSWVKVNNRLDMVDRRISQTGAEALIENTKAWLQQEIAKGAFGDANPPSVELYYPPGLDIKCTPALSVTKAKKANNLVSE